MNVKADSESTRHARPPRRALTAVVGSLASGLLIAIGAGSIALLAAALVSGYRPVVITGGSMGDAAPPGSIVVAGPTDGVVVGDMLVMRAPHRPVITHRVIEIEHHNDSRFALTKGDANGQPDASPYPLGDDELVGRAVIPHAGYVLLVVTNPIVLLVSIQLVVGLVTLLLLQRIWGRTSDPDEQPPDDAGLEDGAPEGGGPEEDESDHGGPRDEPSPDGRDQGRGWRGRRRFVAALLAVLAAMAGGTAGALYRSSAPVAGNTFSTPACFDAQIGSVQRGQVATTVDGTQAITIGAVDPTAAFVMASVRSSSNEPADAMVMANLAGATTLELTRRTDGGPSTVVVEWSVVEYACGVGVQRGVVSGSGTAQLDTTIASVDTGSSFVLLSSVGPATETAFDGSALAIAELTSQTNLRLRTMAPGTLPTGASYAWQVVTFDDPGDASVQTVSTNLAASTSATLPITAVDPETTLVLATAASGSAGADVGERLVRAHLASSTSIDVARAVSGDPIEVHVQVIDLRDGSTVEHGTIDFGAAQTTRTVTIDPVDQTRTVALSTVQVPGAQAGGMTAMVADDVAGEGSATFEVTDPSTITITRDASTATASFGWQAVEWGGPIWWDSDYTFRQRIDVTAGSAATPGGYSVPVTFDHAALVSTGLARADGDDVRVLRWDGSTWSELDRILEDGGSWSSGATTLWFSTVDPVAADAVSSYWLYYGNDGTPASPLADPENVWLLTEDFESGTLGDFEDRTGGTAWYGADAWTRRIPVTVGAGTVDADLAEFALLVDITSADLAANAQADGDDIRFTAADGTTALAHEIERWSPGSGALTAWVKVPELAAGATTTVYLYYGAADAPAMADVRSTWSGETIAVWHFGRDPSGPAPNIDDSTVGNLDGVSAGTMTTGDLVGGLAGWAVDLDGIDDRFDLGTWDLDTHPELTASAWVNLDSVAGEGRILVKGTNPSSRILELGNDGAAARARLSVSGTTAEVSAGTLSTGAWHHLAAVWDGTTLQLYVDGVRVGSSPAYGVIDTGPGVPVSVGDFNAGGGPLDGRIDQIRLESTARPSAWITAVEANRRSPGTFATIGSPQTGSWFGQGAWSKRKPLTIDADQVDSTLADHPVLIQLTDTELAASAKADGTDIVFTAADGTTRLDHQIESWNGGTGALTAWVSIPSLDAATDTGLYVYYGNPGAPDQQDPAAVFGPDADLIAHLGG